MGLAVQQRKPIECQLEAIVPIAEGVHLPIDDKRWPCSREDNHVGYRLDGDVCERKPERSLCYEPSRIAESTLHPLHREQVVQRRLNLLPGCAEFLPRWSLAVLNAAESHIFVV